MAIYYNTLEGNMQYGDDPYCFIPSTYVYIHYIQWMVEYHNAIIPDGMDVQCGCQVLWEQLSNRTLRSIRHYEHHRVTTVSQLFPSNSK